MTGRQNIPRRTDLQFKSWGEELVETALGFMYYMRLYQRAVEMLPIATMFDNEKWRYTTSNRLLFNTDKIVGLAKNTN